MSLVDRTLRASPTAVAMLGLLSLTTGSARADVTVDGGDVGGQTWTAALGPYHVTGKSGDVTIPAGKELRIEAGAVVLFSDATPATKVSVAGTLIVEGTAAAPVVLQAEPDATGLWGGIWAGSSTGNTSKIVMTGAVLRKGAFCLWLPRNAQVALSQTTIDGCTVGITVEDGTYAFDGITVQRNGTGIDVQGGPSDNPMVTVSDSVLTGNTLRGVNVLSAAVKIVNCTVDGNATGVNVGNIAALGSNVAVAGSILSNNARAIDIDESATTAPIAVQVASTTFWSNTYNRRIKRSTGYESVGPTEAVPGDGNGVADPKYVSATDFHLTPGSPCVDSAGPSGGTQDRDGRPRPLGAAVDRGAYELDPNGGGAGAGAGRGGGQAGAGSVGGGNGGVAGLDGAPGDGTGGASGGAGGGRGGAGRSGTVSGGISGSAGAGAGGAAGSAGGAPAAAAAGGGVARAAGGAGGMAPAAGKPAAGGCGCTVTDFGPEPLALLCAALLIATRARPRRT